MRKTRIPVQRSAAAMALCLLFWLWASPLHSNPFYTGSDANAPGKPRQGTPLFVSAQAEFRERIGTAFRSFADAPGLAPILTVIAASFLYGLLHAAGPGHRKTVIFSLFLGRKTPAWEPLAAGFLSAGVHAASGAAILAVLSLVRGAVASLTQAESLIVWLDGATLCVIGLMALGLIASATIRLVRGSAHGHAMAGKSVYSILAFSSMVPCPGAIMVMMFALYVDAPLLGAVSFLAMSLGMGIVVSASAYLAWFGREGVFSAMKSRESLIRRISAGLEIVSYSLVLAFSLYTAWPFVISILTPA